MEVKLEDYFGMKGESIERFTEEMQNDAYNFSRIKEPSLYEIVTKIVQKMEQWEMEIEKEKYRKNLFEIDQETKKKREQEAAKKAKEEQEK